MTSHGALRRSLAVLFLFLLPACYSYVPLKSGEPQVGQDVQVHFTKEGAREKNVPIPANGDATLEGLVLRNLGDSITLASKASYREGHFATGFDRDTLTVAMSSLSEIDQSQIDAGRTAVLIGLGAGAIALAVILVANANPANSGPPSGGGGKGVTSQGFGIRIPIGIP